MAVLFHVPGCTEYVAMALTSVLKGGVSLFPVSGALLLISELLHKDVYQSSCLIKFVPCHCLATSKAFLFINIMLRDAFIQK